MLQQVKFRIRDTDLVLETGHMAKQANGAVVARCGGSTVIATVCASDKEIEGIDYVPLMVDYNEKYYAAGKIPGGFYKREGRPRDKEILISRIIDRPLRPLFYKSFGRDIQIIPTTIATDLVNPPDILGVMAACTAVHISDIPFAGPVAAVRVAVVEGEFIINPTFEEIKKSTLDIIVAGGEKGITMVEGGGYEVSEDLMIQAIERAHVTIKELCAVQEELRRLCGKPKMALKPAVAPLDAEAQIRAWVMPRLEQASFVKGKQNRGNAIHDLKKEFQAKNPGLVPEERSKDFDKLFEDLETEVVRKAILDKGIRTDGRGPSEIRPITCEIDVLPRTHGSALFTRGETQALVVTTLGTPYDEQIMDDIDGDYRKNFMLHYNFPPFSVGETGRLGTGRREVGHGHLAQRSIERVLPSKEEFRYTVRVVSEILESNGSSSMATVCGTTLSLLNAGVPMKKPVAGIAMGLVQGDTNFVVLSDILGEEDHLGHMDFKVAGTRDGITGFQMDIKIQGVSSDVLRTALTRAREGRLHILEIMGRTIDAPRGDVSEFAPKVITLRVPEDKIGLIIGPGGKMINGISEKTGAQISIEDDGTTTIYCRSKTGAEDAMRTIQGLIQEPEIGRVYPGTVTRIMDFGAFVEFMPGREGLVHISKLSRERVEKVSDVLHEGQEIPVKLVEIDRMGRLNLSYIDAIQGDPGAPAGSAEGAAPQGPREPRDGGRPRDRGGRGPRTDSRPPRRR
jgi:polyribonucleotide nucleotidyltransferase